MFSARMHEKHIGKMKLFLFHQFDAEMHQCKTRSIWMRGVIHITITRETLTSNMNSEKEIELNSSPRDNVMGKVIRTHV